MKISVNEEIPRVLERLKREYPTLDYPELFKLGLAELDRKCALEARRRWSERLPIMQVSEEEAASIAEARGKIGASGREPMTAEELINSLTED